MQTLIADIETDNLLPDMTRIWCLVIRDQHSGITDSYTSSSISEGVQRLQEADRVVMHNGIGFDHPALEKFGYHFDITKIYDTLIASRLVNPQRDGGHSLRAWGQTLGFPKGEASFDQLSDELIEYCVRDIELTAKVYEKLVPAAPHPAIEIEHEVAIIMAKQERNGFAFDCAKAEALAADLYAERKDNEQQLTGIFPPIYVKKKEMTPKANNSRMGYVKNCSLTKVERQVFNPGSRQQIAERLIRKYGWKPKRFTPSGLPEISETTLAGLEFPEAKALHRYLRTEKMLSMLISSDKSWLKLVEDGRIHGQVNTLGARTGRMTHRNPNVAQADGDPRMRALFVPREGWQLVGIDADGLEARLLGHYLARYDEGEFADRVVNGDFHSFNQKICDLESRNSAKRLFFAFMYGAGDGKIGQIVHDDRPFKQAKTKVGKATRKKLAAGTTGLEALVMKVRQTAATRKYVTGLDKRHLPCPSPHSALNTLIQGAGAVVMKQALIDFDQRAPAGGWGYCANVHDEVQLEARPDLTKDIAELMVDCIQSTQQKLSLRCQMNGSYSIGNNWSETH